MDDVHLDFLNIFLPAALSLEAILIPVIGFMMELYLRAKDRQFRIASTYSNLIWLMLGVLFSCSVMSAILTVYYFNYTTVNLPLILYVAELIYLALLVILPLCMTFLWSRIRR